MSIVFPVLIQKIICNSICSTYLFSGTIIHEQIFTKMEDKFMKLNYDLDEFSFSSITLQTDNNKRKIILETNNVNLYANSEIYLSNTDFPLSSHFYKEKKRNFSSNKTFLFLINNKYVEVEVSRSNLIDSVVTISVELTIDYNKAIFDSSSSIILKGKLVDLEQDFQSNRIVRDLFLKSRYKYINTKLDLFYSVFKDEFIEYNLKYKRGLIVTDDSSNYIVFFSEKCDIKLNELYESIKKNSEKVREIQAVVSIIDNTQVGFCYEILD
jgi:hypothetical protein